MSGGGRRADTQVDRLSDLISDLLDVTRISSGRLMVEPEPIAPVAMIRRVVELEQTAFSTGAVDLLVTSYRSTPELLAVLLRASTERERLAALIRAAADEDLADAVGQPVYSGEDPRRRLSRREREVYELLADGLTNRQIAKLLFIQESTVKVHVHHIYDKLGTRSRTALAVQAILERADQATSATDTSTADDDSS